MIHTALTSDPVEVAAQLAAHDARGYGASAMFVGRVRGDGGLTELFLEHHPAMTPGALDALAATAAARWCLDQLTLIHRIGAMGPGEPIVLVLASSAHRDGALAACTFLIDRLKTDVPLWKRESFADGRSAWVAARASDDVRAAAWEDP